MHRPRETTNPNISPKLQKYYKKRHILFSKYDDGIRIDEDSWFSVTPEKVAEQIALNYKGKVILEGCCGVGGNAIQFAKYGSKCIAVDNQRERLDFL